MIHELAIDPVSPSEWSPQVMILLRAYFDRGGPARVSKFPTNWARLACNHPAAVNDLRVREFVTYLNRHAVRRDGVPYDDAGTWFANAEAQNSSRPFAAIISPAAAGVVGARTPDDALEFIAQMQRTATPLRTATALASLLEPMLRFADRVVFADPYADPASSRYRETLTQLIMRVAPRALSAISLVVRPGCAPGAATNEVFEARAREHWEPELPVGAVVTVRRVLPSGEDLHDRFVLASPVAGVQIGHGLAAGVAHTTETLNVSLLSASDFEKRWSQYGGINPTAFDIDYEFVLRGPTRP